MLTTVITQGLSPDSPNYRIREEVFLKEQKFKVEFDETDRTAWQILLLDDGIPIAAGRLFPKGPQSGAYILGRIAVVREKRGRHYGAEMVRALEQKAASLGAAQFELSAQAHARGFYEKLGYLAVGDLYFDEHVPAIRMLKDAPAPTQKKGNAENV